MCHILFLAVVILKGYNAVAQKTPKNSFVHAIPWEPIRDADILWRKQVWRRIDISEKNNAVFRNDPKMPAENIFANILLNGVMTGMFNAYTENDTAFIKPLSVDTITAIIACNPANLSRRSRVYLNYSRQHPNSKVDFSIDTSQKNASRYDTGYVSTCVYPQQVEYYSIKEEWMFDRNKGVMIVRIAAIAPEVMVNGKITALFWLKYPDIRNHIAKYEVYNSNDTEKYTYTWDEYFESRQFSSLITHVEGGMKNEVIKEEKPQKHRRKKKHKQSEEIFNQQTNVWVY